MGLSARQAKSGLASLAPKLSHLSVMNKSMVDITRINKAALRGFIFAIKQHNFYSVNRLPTASVGLDFGIVAKQHTRGARH